MKLLLDHGCSIGLGGVNYSPLHVACKVGNVEACKILLEHKDCDVDLKNGLGNTALHQACYEGNESICKLLIENEADILVENCDEEWPLEISQRNCVQILMDGIDKQRARLNSCQELLKFVPILPDIRIAGKTIPFDVGMLIFQHLGDCLTPKEVNLIVTAVRTNKLRWSTFRLAREFIKACK